MNEKLPPIHPGEILMEEFLKPMKISQYRLAKDISVPPGASTKLSMGCVPSPPILLLGYLVFLGFRKGFGLTCKSAMILKWKKTTYKTVLKRKFVFTQSLHNFYWIGKHTRSRFVYFYCI